METPTGTSRSRARSARRHGGHGHRGPGGTWRQHDHDHVHGPAGSPRRSSVSASLPSQNIGPLDFTAEPDPAEPGAYVIEDASLSIAGDWDLRVEALMGEFDLLTENITVPIQGG